MRLSEFTRNRLLGSRAEILAWRLLVGLGTLQMPTIPYGVRFGIIGVGIHSEPQGPSKPKEKIVVLILEVPPISTRLMQIIHVPFVYDAIRAVSLPGEDWSDIWVWGVLDPTLNIMSGDKIRGFRNGTAGAPITWNVGYAVKVGILTAGHVAGSSASVTVSGVVSGTVSACVLPTSGGVDVAAVELPSPSPSRRLSMTGVTGATNIDMLTSTRTAGRIVAKTAWFYWASYTATYLDLYVTHSVISAGGDSGSAVTLTGSTDFVGTLVGASSGSLIQDGRTQLSALTSLSGITL